MTPEAARPAITSESTGPQVRRHYLSPTQETAAHAANHGTASIDLDISSHTFQFSNMHETVFKNRFVHNGGSCCQGHESHELRLEIGSKPGIGKCRHIYTAQTTMISLVVFRTANLETVLFLP